MDFEPEETKTKIMKMKDIDPEEMFDNNIKISLNSIPTNMRKLWLYFVFF